ncbi:MAG: VapC toxin family PIN domain ribonuclease [Sideroxydans sp.]|nr:VapC toxin family PIN domain ribonuclease [Sideroxydans sp.]
MSDWLGAHLKAGWASCPITQNGCLHILSQPSYPNAVLAAQIAERLTAATQHHAHEFWADSVSLLNDQVDWQKILSSRHLTDVYLLALATQQGGRFVTLDRGIPLAAIAGAKAKNLLVLGGS